MKYPMTGITLIVEPDNCHAFFYRTDKEAGVELYYRSQERLSVLHQWIVDNTNWRQTVNINPRIAGRTAICFYPV